MPTYEYLCPQGHAFEVFQKMSDEPRATCPECGAEAERQISAGGGFLFKGEGFYITDYRSAEYKKKAEAEKGGGGKGGKGDEGAAASGAGSSGGAGSDPGGSSGGSAASGSSGSSASPGSPGAPSSGSED